MSGTEAIVMLLIVAGQCLILLLVVPIAEAIEDWRRAREMKEPTMPSIEPKFNLSVLKERTPKDEGEDE